VSDAAEKRATLFLQHPDESPALIGVLPYLIHPPSRLSSTASWVAFRDKTVLPMMRADPDDPNLPNFLAQVEAILAWRSSVRPEDRFWKPDARSIMTADDTVLLAERVLAQRYPLADSALAAGSLVRGGATATSDLDLVVLFNALPNAHRESFVFDGTPVDAFVHDPETLRAFFGKDVEAGKSAMLTMAVEGRIVGPRREQAEAMKAEAQAIVDGGPPPFDAATLDLYRYGIASRIEDLQDPRPWPEVVATGAWLHLALADFILRANGRWAATAKWIPRTLAAFDPALASDFDAAFAELFERRNAGPLISFAEQALVPFGGRLFDGYRVEAKPADRIAIGAQSSIPPPAPTAPA
jgi:hypothetical protein